MSHAKVSPSASPTPAPPAASSHVLPPPERAMTMTEPPSYNATVSASAPPPHAHASALEQGLGDTTPLDNLHTKPAMIICPYCHQKGMTRVDARNTAAAFLVSCLLCFVCIIASILPFVFRWFQDKHHYCTNCGKEVAVRHSNGGIEVHKELPKYPASGQTANGHGNSYPMVNMGAPQGQQGQQNEQVSSFLSTNVPREQNGVQRPQ